MLLSKPPGHQSIASVAFSEMTVSPVCLLIIFKCRHDLNLRRGERKTVGKISESFLSIFDNSKLEKISTSSFLSPLFLQVTSGKIRAKSEYFKNNPQPNFHQQPTKSLLPCSLQTSNSLWQACVKTIFELLATSRT